MAKTTPKTWAYLAVFTAIVWGLIGLAIYLEFW